MSCSIPDSSTQSDYAMNSNGFRYNESMTITILGASGFLGQNLIRHLLATTDHQLRAFCRTAAQLDFGSDRGRVELISGDVLRAEDLQQALRGADAAYYLVHMMGSTEGDFYELEARAAHNVADVAERCDVARLIFMGGLGNDNDTLSKHLSSRHNTGRILREHARLVIEFRASMIVGHGSIAYEVVRTIAHRLPVLMVPSWAVTHTQPITLHDALEYLTAALIVRTTTSQIIEIGGPQPMTYEDVVVAYGRSIGRRETIFAIPFVPHWAAIVWINLFMPAHHSGVAKPMVDSLSNEMVVTTDTARRLFPTIHPEPIANAL